MSFCHSCWSMFTQDNALLMLMETVQIRRDRSSMDKAALEGCLMCQHLLGMDKPTVQWKQLEELLEEFALNEARHMPSQEPSASQGSLWSKMSSRASSTAQDLVSRLRWASNRSPPAEPRGEEASRGLSEAESSYRITLSLDRHGSSIRFCRYTLKRGVSWEPEREDLTLQVSILSGDPARVVTQQLTPCNEFESASLWEEAYRWIADCRQHHARCNSKNVNIPEGYPSRALDVSLAQQGYVHLVSMESPSPRYVALSYCWGGLQDYSLSTQNIETYHRKIPVDCLGRTIQDAVTVCLRLGYNFLWVDSLCIVQDSDEDRAKELGRMAAIYANADLTLSAALAPSYDAGFLHAPPPIHAPRPFLLPFKLPDGATGKLCLYKRSPGVFDTNWPPVRAEPIRARAWTMQERFMSRRLLVFQENMLWACHEHFGHHGGSLTQHSYSRRATGPSVVGRPEGQSDLLAYSGTKVNHAQWHAMVQEYSTKLLTYPEDRLPALSSMAEFFARSLSDQYLAGLWRGNIWVDLLWTGAIHGLIATEDEPSTTKAPSRLTRPRAWRAPSWSFVSVEGQIKFKSFRSNTQEIAELIDCTVTPVSPQAPYGQVESAILRLHAFLLLGRPTKNGGTTQFHTEPELQDSPMKPRRRVMIGNVYYDVAAEKRTTWNSKNDIIESNYGVISDTQPLWCCPLIACRWGTDIDLWGLVVARLPNGLYHRVGILNGRWIPEADWQFVCQANPREDIMIV